MSLLEPIPEKLKPAVTRLTLVSESSTTRKLMESNLRLQLIRILSVKQVKSIAQFVASKQLVALPFLSMTMAALTSLVQQFGRASYGDQNDNVTHSGTLNNLCPSKSFTSTFTRRSQLFCLILLSLTLLPIV